MKKITYAILILIIILASIQFGFNSKEDSSNSGVATASVLKIGDTIPTYEIKDQFEKIHVMSPDSQTIFVAGDMDSYKILRDYLITKEEGFLKANKANYLADITGMPSLVSEYIALPKMKEYTFSILLLSEAQTSSFTTKTDILTAYILRDGKVSDIKFIKDAAELDLVFK